MLTVKVLEVRDEATFISVMAIKMVTDDPVQAYYVHGRAGYGPTSGTVILVILGNVKATNDPYDWAALGMGPRTMSVAHQWIESRFDSLKDGDVIDVSFILGETKEIKTSERFG